MAHVRDLHKDIACKVDQKLTHDQRLSLLQYSRLSVTNWEELWESGRMLLNSTHRARPMSVTRNDVSISLLIPGTAMD